MLKRPAVKQPRCSPIFFPLTQTAVPNCALYTTSRATSGARRRRQCGDTRNGCAAGGGRRCLREGLAGPRAFTDAIADLFAGIELVDAGKRGTGLVDEPGHGDLVRVSLRHRVGEKALFDLPVSVEGECGAPGGVELEGEQERGGCGKEEGASHVTDIMSRSGRAASPEDEGDGEQRRREDDAKGPEQQAAGNRGGEHGERMKLQFAAENSRGQETKLSRAWTRRQTRTRRPRHSRPGRQGTRRRRRPPAHQAADDRTRCSAPHRARPAATKARGRSRIRPRRAGRRWRRP